MTFKEFGKAVLAAGLKPRFCNPQHWQIRGGKFIVNVYPDTKRGTRYYVNCAAHGVNGSIGEAVSAALGGLSLQPTPKAKRRGASWRRNRKKALLAKDPHCHYCRCELTWEIATLDHWIPLGAGGGDFENNYRLACRNCNAKKGCKIPG
jgi:hypothetical protein